MVQYVSLVYGTRNIMICTYCWWLSVARGREIEQDELVEGVCNVL